MLASSSSPAPTVLSVCKPEKHTTVIAKQSCIHQRLLVIECDVNVHSYNACGHIFVAFSNLLLQTVDPLAVSFLPSLQCSLYLLLGVLHPLWLQVQLLPEVSRHFHEPLGVSLLQDRDLGLQRQHIISYYKRIQYTNRKSWKKEYDFFLIISGA